METVRERKKTGPKPKVRKLPRELILRQLEELDRLEAEARKKLDEAQKSNPFWFFEPSTGDITEDRREFLSRFINAEDIPQKLDSQLDIILSDAPTVGAFGGNQCIGGETLIYDPVKAAYQRVDEIKEPFYVFSWNGERLVSAKAQAPFVKGYAPLFQVTFSNGKQIVVTSAHKLLTPEGFQKVGELRVGSVVCTPSRKEAESGNCEYKSKQSYDSPKGLRLLLQQLDRNQDTGTEALSQLNSVLTAGDHELCAEGSLHEVFVYPLQSNLDICPSIHGIDVQNLRQTVPDSQDDYHSYCDFYDARFHQLVMDGPNTLPSLIDVHGHNQHCLIEDGQACVSRHSQTYLQAALPSSSNVYGLSHTGVSYADEECCESQVCAKEHGREDCASHKNHKQYIANLETQTITLPTDILPSIETSHVVDVKYIRDDYFYDLTVPVYHNYQDVSTVISANSGKSTIGAVKRYIQVTGEVPISLEGIYPKERLRTDFSYCERVRIVGVDNKTLLNTVIPTYQNWVPREFLKKGSWTESYSAEQRTLFLYRNGVGNPIASFEFMTNQQDTESFQGPPIHRINYDEEPRQAIRKENLMRFVTTGKVDEMFCMTPTNGISWATDIFDGETPEEGVECYKLVSLTNKKASMVALEKIIAGLDSYEERKMRLLGETISLSGLVYGKLFDKRIHVIPPFFEGLNAVQKKDFLLITGMDPHLVTPTAMVFILLDREGNAYVDSCWHKNGDTDEIKNAWHEIVKGAGYRAGWAVADKSSDSSIMAFGGRNIYMELSRGKNAIPALRTSEKFEGSIKAGVDDIKQRLKVGASGKPRFFIVDRPENKILVNSFRTLERDTYANEDTQGPKDRIKEGKHHLHSSLRYAFQYKLNWYPAVDVVPQPTYFDEASCW